jgi:PAS domain S-box-containing protein
VDLELLDVAITTHDPSGALIQANALARGLEVDLAAATAGAVDRALRDRCAARGTIEGPRGAIAVSAIPELGPDGAALRVVCTLRDACPVLSRERLLGATFRAMAEGVTVHGADGKIRMINPAAEAILGLGFEESTRRVAVDPRWRLIDARGEPLRGEDIPSEITQRTGEPCRDVRVGVRRPDGALAWLSVNTAPVFFDGEGAPSAVVATFEDITALLAAREALERSRNEFKRVVDIVPGVIFEYVADDDGAGRFTFVSARVRELVGVEAERVLAEPRALWDRLHPDDREAAQRLLVESARSLTPCEQRARCRGADDEVRWLHGRAVPERRAGATAWVGVLVDVSEEQRLVATLRETQKLELLGDLAAGIAHNFNNLLMIVMPNLEVALADAPPELEGPLVDAAQATQRAAELVHRLMLLARRQTEGRRQRVDLVDAVRDATSLMQQTFDRRIHVEARVPAGAAWMEVSRSELDQVLLNLLINARDAVEGVAAPRIEVILEPAAGRGGVHRLAVRDNGVGMTEEVRRRIGEPFFTTKAAGRGTGLGLATTERQVRGWGGTLVCTTAPGVGTTFTLELPASAP